MVAFFGFGLLAACFHYWQLPHAEKVNAQTSNTEHQQLLDRDRSVSDERVAKAYAEAQKIQDAILSAVKTSKPKFKIHRTSAAHLKYAHDPGRRGETRNEITWRTAKTQLSVTFRLGFSREEVSRDLRFGLERISMGEFFRADGFGDYAVLVKNVVSNREVTEVGLHFVKGRAHVSIYI